MSQKYNEQDESGSGFRIEPPRGGKTKGRSQPCSEIHPKASLNKNDAREEVELSTRPQIQAHPSAEDLSKTNDGSTGKTMVRYLTYCIT